MPAQAAPSLAPAYSRVLRGLVLALALAAGACVCLMMLITCADVLGRAFGRPLTGAYDVVSLLGVLAIACGLPYTTAVKGHVAVEFFFLKLPRRARIVVDTVNRLLVCALFVALCGRSAQYGLDLLRSGEVTPTVQIPVFWVPLVIAASCGLVALVVLHNLLHPGKVLVKP